jgi:hypothetical protein
MKSIKPPITDPNPLLFVLAPSPPSHPLQKIKSMKSPSILLLACLAILGMSSVSAECEVCQKVIDDVRSTMSKPDSRDKSKIEEALGKYCSNKEMGAKERKICYYLDPIKRDVAQPFSTGMSSEKVCKRLEKVNPEVCGVRFAVKTEGMEKKDYSSLRVKQLKQILADRGVECKGCAEKEDFVKRVVETEGMAEL